MAEKSEYHLIPTDEMSSEWDEEKAYDEKIAPLMEKVIEACKTHGIPFIASFAYKGNLESSDEMTELGTYYMDHQPCRSPMILLAAKSVLVDNQIQKDLGENLPLFFNAKEKV